MAGQHIFDKATIELRDGERLAAKVFRASEGAASALHLRTPYGVDATLGEGMEEPCPAW